MTHFLYFMWLAIWGVSLIGALCAKSDIKTGTLFGITFLALAVLTLLSVLEPTS